MIPYDKLYIYEIDGRVKRGDNTFPPDYIGTWWEGEHSFLFFSQEEDGVIQSLLKDDPALHLIDRFTISYRDWQGGDEIGPIRVGRLVFVPSWLDLSPVTDEILITLDPSVVFGTGLHPTTRSCLEGVWTLYEKERPQTVLDLGTGTGILALACAKLGADRILAVDCNPLAVKTAKKNVSLNKEDGRVAVIEGNAEDLIREPGDLVCCNLHHEVLDRLLCADAFFQKRWSLLSGFLKRETENIVQRLRREGVCPEIISKQEPWQTILGFNPSVEVSQSLSHVSESREQGMGV
ncbi:MAG: methyltransferase domain-containing protein [Proteobacteria bacterium]|nr:methyltransferase domain-containing protein [Pseudomonadota bacterium]